METFLTSTGRIGSHCRCLIFTLGIIFGLGVITNERGREGGREGGREEDKEGKIKVVRRFETDMFRKVAVLVAEEALGLSDCS
jgi:hypothetical protein